MLHLTNPLLGFLQVAFDGLADVAAAGTEAVQLENRALVHSEKKFYPHKQSVRHPFAKFPTHDCSYFAKDSIKSCANQL